MDNELLDLILAIIPNIALILSLTVLYSLKKLNNTELGKELQKHIELEHAYNLTNSDVFAKFIVSGSTLSNPDILGKIQINKDKGTLVDIYHEAWHAFSQLYLTRKQ